MTDDRDAGATRRRWEPSPWSERPAAYVVALAVWAVVGVFYLPVLSMILTPVWMVFFVSILPRWVVRARRRVAGPA